MKFANRLEAGRALAPLVASAVAACADLEEYDPPLVLGVIKTETGSYSLGFVLLAMFCFVCFLLNYFVLLRGARTSQSANAQSIAA